MLAGSGEPVAAARGVTLMHDFRCLNKLSHFSLSIRQNGIARPKEVLFDFQVETVLVRRRPQVRKAKHFVIGVRREERGCVTVARFKRKAIVEARLENHQIVGSQPGRDLAQLGRVLVLWMDEDFNLKVDKMECPISPQSGCENKSQFAQISKPRAWLIRIIR